VGLGLALLLTLSVWGRIRRVDQARLEALRGSQASSIVLQVERRMQNLEQVLRGAAGYLGRGALPTRAEWHAYVGSLDLATTHPGLQGLTFVEWIPPEALAAHVQRMRQEGFPDYTVAPGGPLEPSPEGTSSIIYLEPMDFRNQRAFGKDMLADPVRREAMLRARDTGQVTLSGRVTLYQETESGIQPGAVLFAPVYRGGAPVETVADRRRALRGWATIPLRMTDFMRATLPREGELADIEIYDGPGVAPERLLFDSDPAFEMHELQARQVQALSVTGRVWTAQIDPSPAFFAQMGRTHHWEILIGGLVTSLLLFLLLAILQGSGNRARQLAWRHREDLLASEAHYSALFEKAPLGMAIVESDSGRFRAVNGRLAEILGYTREELEERTFQSVTHPDHLDADVASVQDLADGKLEEVWKEKRYFHRQGKVIWARLGLVRVPTPPGQPRRHLCLVEDITETRGRAEELRASLDRFRTLFDLAPDPITLTRLSDGKVVLANQAWLDLTGFRLDDLLDSPSSELAAWIQHEARGDLMEELRRTGFLSPKESIFRKRDGTECLLLVTAKVLDMDGETFALIAAKDLTDRARMEQALKESETRLRTLGNQLPDTFLYQYSRCTEGRSRFHYLSEGVTRLCGLKAEEVMRDPGLLLGQIDPALLPAYLEAEETSARNLSPFTMDLRIRHADGRWRWFQVRSAPRHLPDGSVVWEGISTDVTEQKLGQSLLEESEARFRSVSEDSPVPLFLHRDGRFIYVNPAALRLLGAKEDASLVGQPILDRVHPDDRERVLERVRLAQNLGQELPPLEERFLTLDGSVVEVEVLGRSVSYGGRPTMLIFAQDISARKRMMAALQESEARFRTLADSAPVFIWLSDPDGRCTHFNQTWSEWTGEDADQALGNGWATFVHPDDFPGAYDTYLRSLEARIPFTMEFRLRHRSGSYRWISDRGIPRFATDGTFLGYIGAGLDIQDRKETEAAILGSELRARKAESLVLMAGGIAHDFNNLFQSIQGNLEVAGMRAQGSSFLTEPLNRAMGALNRAVSLSWKMLDFSGHGFVQLESFNLETWLPAYLSVLRLEFPPAFHLHLACDPVPVIKGDRSKLEQVVKAILDNALEASPTSAGHVHMRLFVDFGGDRPGPDSPGIWPLKRPELPATVCLDIADDGPGVPQDKLDLICDPFYSSKATGRGLGLPAAVGILTAHQAGLHVFNGEGRGLVLRLHFPPSGA
jgi:PAS domain S-box-containing protein